MNMPSNTMPQSFDGPAAIPAVVSRTRPLYWSVRRELWENRSVYIAPLAAAAVFLIGFLVSLIFLPARMRALSALDLAHQREAIAMPYDMIAGLMMITAMIVGAFYCLGAFQSERRDRSILFWKSLPVSDLTAVLAKAIIPIVILPLLAFAITFVTQWIMLLLSSMVLWANGLSVATLWTQLSFFQMSLLLLYHIVTVHALWEAPILRLPAAGFSLGAARGISVGDLTSDRDWRRRKDRVPHLAPRRHVGISHERRRYGGFHAARQLPHGPDDPPHASHIPGQPGSVVGTPFHRPMPCRSGAATPLPRSELSDIRLVQPCNENQEAHVDSRRNAESLISTDRTVLCGGYLSTDHVSTAAASVRLPRPNDAWHLLHAGDFPAPGDPQSSGESKPDCLHRMVEHRSRRGDDGAVYPNRK